MASQEIRRSPKKEAIRLTKIWQDFGPNEYPIDISCLITGLIQSGAIPDDLITIVQEFDSFEGMLRRTESDNQWLILLNSSVENERRLRFTHAHELGHYMCHRHLSAVFRDGNETLDDFISELELEANTFAAWLLMPANIIRTEFGGHIWNIYSLKELGSRFECSLQASALRYIDLYADRKISFVCSRDGMILWSKKSRAAPYMSSYKFGDELPSGSLAKKVYESGIVDESSASTKNTWSSTHTSHESSYLEDSGSGFQYTCLSFDRDEDSVLDEERHLDLVDRFGGAAS